MLGGEACDELVSHPGDVEILLVTSVTENTELFVSVTLKNYTAQIL